MKKLAPIILFVYNRPIHTKHTVQALQKNTLASQSEIFIYSDGAKNDNQRELVNAVRKYLKEIEGFKKITVIERHANLGLANSIIDGVTKIVNEFGKVIVLEDDLVTSPYFLSYMNDGLSLYENDENVASIHGYVYPIDRLPETFFIKGADCWGWATWKRAWNIFEPDGKVLLEKLTSRGLQNEADFNGSYQYTKMLEDQIIGKNNSWAIRWYMSAFLEDMLTLYPGKSFVENIGNDGSGTHSEETKVFSAIPNACFTELTKINVVENSHCRTRIEEFFLSMKRNIFYRIYNKIIRVFK
ncbi:glycosyltransferase [Methylophaga marina]|uniref:Glycosyltransferase n=1 Tax=Methylophaga marina TaxID=45495 RepID=A0ABP3CRQ6_9GAMM